MSEAAAEAGTSSSSLSDEADAFDKANPPAKKRRGSGGLSSQAVSYGPTVNVGSGGFEAPIIPLLLIGFGGYLLWFGVKYWRGTGPAVWPSYPVKSVLQGKGLPPNIPAPPASTIVAAYEQGIAGEAAATQPGGGTPGGTPGGPTPTGSAQHMARLLLARYGWAATQMGPLILLWNQESGWRNCAFNVSGAYGIAQALGHGGGACATGPRCDGASSPGLNCAYGGYGQSASDSRSANAGNALKQIEWGLNYIRSTYGDPSGAWAHEQQFGWY